jgi:hypothetical protein
MGSNWRVVMSGANEAIASSGNRRIITPQPQLRCSWGHNQEPEQDVTMRVGSLTTIGLLAIGAAIGLRAAQAQDAAAQEKALEGTYTQKQACKGDGSGADQAKNRVVIHDKQVDSNFGPCTFGDKQWSGKVLKAVATCKNKTGSTFDVSLEFTLKDDNTVSFFEESSQYKSTLYRCPNAAK